MELKDLKLMSISELCREHKISKYAVYTLIKTDPTFPCLNLGPKKNYRISSEDFVRWISAKMRDRHCASFEIPNAEQLLKVGTP